MPGFVQLHCARNGGLRRPAKDVQDGLPHSQAHRFAAAENRSSDSISRSRLLHPQGVGAYRAANLEAKAALVLLQILALHLEQFPDEVRESVRRRFRYRSGARWF